MIFPSITTDSITQVGEKLRYSVDKSFVSPDEGPIVSIEVQPDGFSFIDVTEKLYLDWAYLTAGTKTATVKVTTAGGDASTTCTINVVTKETDSLLSFDTDLIALEPDIMGYLPSSKSTFNYAHRQALTRILGFLDDKRVFGPNGERITKQALVDKTDYQEWSTALALAYIFQGLSNQVDDIFDRKSKFYFSDSEIRSAKSVLRVDTTNTGDSNTVKKIDNFTGSLVRR